MRRAALLTLILLVAGVAMAACGGGRSTPGVAATSTMTTAAAGASASGAARGTGLLAYSSCMRSHGVPNFPDPAGTGGIPKEAVIQAFSQVSNAQAQAASQSCRRLLPAGGSLSGQPSRPVTAADERDYLRAATCMRSHGITDFPDPTFSGGQVNLSIPSSINTQSTQFTRALHVCQRLIPRGLPGSGSQG